MLPFIVRSAPFVPTWPLKLTVFWATKVKSAVLLMLRLASVSRVKVSRFIVLSSLFQPGKIDESLMGGEIVPLSVLKL